MALGVNMTTEERLTKLEHKMLVILTGGTVLFSCILAFFTYEKWLDIPAKVTAEFANTIGQEKLDLLNSAAVKAKTIDSALSILPVGTILAWHKSLENTPVLSSHWKECDGTRIEDPDSPYYNLDAPDLNENALFLRGSHESGLTEAQDWKALKIASTHIAAEGYTHGPTVVPKDVTESGHIFGGYWNSHPANSLYFSYDTEGEIRPINMRVTWIIKIK